MVIFTNKYLNMGYLILQMKFDKKELIIITLILTMFIVAFYFYPRVPDQVPTHWNAKGEVDDYNSKFFGLFFMPILMTAIYLLFLIIPKIAVFRKNVEEFYDKYFFGFKLVFVLFFAVIYTAMILATLGYKIKMTYFVIPAISMLFFYIGYMLQFAKRNYFIGIRTPWTLSNDEVWEKTHKLGSKLFMFKGVIILSSLFFEEYAILLLIVLVAASVTFLFVYSFLEYKKVEK